ncbi:hypothetical protein, partial [Mesorhizobium sp. M7A.F.Ca.CA.001.08.2.1]|uniref:hypothetical protein n=1 Tax=Mesorhizobium sp. M7A.F.Ca.CA.001.08.2.1 TaxID=2496692 RepID=UPI0019D17959
AQRSIRAFSPLKRLNEERPTSRLSATLKPIGSAMPPRFGFGNTKVARRDATSQIANTDAA